MLIYEQVFRLQISVDEVQGVKILKGEDYLSCIKSCMVFAERGDEQLDTDKVFNTALQIHNEALEMLYLNLPIRLRCENISPPGTYSITM